MRKPLYQFDLDPYFFPISMWARDYRRQAEKEGWDFVVTLEGESGRVTSWRGRVSDLQGANTRRYLEYAVKTLLWARGGWKITIAGPSELSEWVQNVFSPKGARAFDVEFMTLDVYRRPIEVLCTELPFATKANEHAVQLGGHSEGCRIGFDIGASDIKAAAVLEGQVIWTKETPWNPKAETDPVTLQAFIQDVVHQAGNELPRVDAIGGSSAGIIIDNEVRVASWLRSVPVDIRREHANLFIEAAKAEEPGVPLVVLNDGDVTALAGARAIPGHRGVLGIAMGTSEAGGYVNPEGEVMGWLNELAFVPIDMGVFAQEEEWSGDLGCGADYFCQKAVRLAEAIELELAGEGLPQKLESLQALQKEGNWKAGEVYRTIGQWLGYAIPWYREFYEFSHVLLLGRVMTGAGGKIIQMFAQGVIQTEFPELDITINVPEDDEKVRCGQAIEAAGLPIIK